MDKDLKLGGTKVVAKFNALYDRLMARRRGRPASYTRGGYNKKLLAPQDSSLKDYCLMLYAFAVILTLTQFKLVLHGLFIIRLAIKTL
jgi:hypothetical protein